MRILITGGAGFIGSHLAERYLERGEEVDVLDDLSTGSIDNIQLLTRHPRFKYHIDSVTNHRSTAKLVEASDLVVHLAAAVGVRLVVQSPVRTIETNIKGTEVVLRLAAKKRKRVLIASTSEVYGKRTSVPFREDDDLLMGPPNKGRWSYACSKALDEFLALAYWKERRVPTVIVRLFNTVGPRQTGRYGMVVPTFVRQALEQRPLTIFGDGSQTRCFAHVHDVVGAIMSLAEHPYAVGEVFNVGNDQEITIRDLADRIRHRTGSFSPIQFVPYERAHEEGFEDMQRRVPDLSKLRELTGYEPKWDIDGILDSVIAHESQGGERRSIPALPFALHP